MVVVVVELLAAGITGGTGIVVLVVVVTVVIARNGCTIVVPGGRGRRAAATNVSTAGDPSAVSTWKRFTPGEEFTPIGTLTAGGGLIPGVKYFIGIDIPQPPVPQGLS